MKKTIIYCSFLMIYFGSPSFQLNAQCQISLEIIELFCMTDSTYNLTIDINASNLPGDSVEVSINGDIINQYEIDAFPLTFSDIVQSGGMNDSISVCAVNNDLCCDVLEYSPPTNYCADCFNYWLEYEYSCDTDSTYEFILTPITSFPDQMSPEGSLYVNIDGQIFEFEYEIGNAYTISGVQLFGNTVYHEVLYFFLEVNCGVSVLFLASPDCEELCSVDSVEVADFICTSDSTYNMVVDANFMVSQEISEFVSVRVSVNDEVLGFYSLDSIPITLEDISVSNDGVSTIELCVLGAVGDCCIDLEYSGPECVSVGVSESNVTSEVLIYPNPVADIIQLESIEGELFIYDASGRQVMHKKQPGHQVDVGLLHSGIYYLAVIGESTGYVKFIKQ
jgi:hypothetical protein